MKHMIYKYRIGSVWRGGSGAPIKVELPEGATILSVQTQDEEVMVWARVNPNAVQVSRWFVIIGTGHDVPNPKHLIHLTTYQHEDEVWHVFEEKQCSP